METKIAQQMPLRPLGSQGLIVSQQGIGLMGMTGFYGNFDPKEQEAENLRTIGKALECGINFFDTAWIYQSFGRGGGENTTNEELLGKAIKMYGREKFVVATKFGILANSTGMIGISGSEETIRRQLYESLTRLGIDCIDLYYQHRMDPKTPIEETVGTLKALVAEGKIKYIGLSECTPEELRRAHAVHPVTAIQMEWSLQTRSIESALLPVARELGVGIVPYSPLGRGFLTASFKSIEDLDESDWRRSNPRFQAQNFEKNAAQHKFFEFAAKKGCTPAQLALAWLHSQGEDVFPIPGTKSQSRIIENSGAILFVPLSKSEIEELGLLVPEGEGDRYTGMSGTFESRVL